MKKTLLILFFFSGPAFAADYHPQGYYAGVNLSGAEFGSGTVLHRDYTYPTDEEFAYFQNKGMRIIRLPFKWERVQPQLMGDLDLINLGELDRCVATAHRLGLFLLLDLNNYGERLVDGKIALLGSDSLHDEAFDDVWTRLANHYKTCPFVWFGLMNEPHKQTALQNAATMQAAVNAIRGTGALNTVLVSGTSSPGAHSWISSGNASALQNFRDPGNNFAFEVHQYLDADDSGNHAEAVPGKGQTVLADFTNWAAQHHVRAFLGETGWDGHPANPQANREGDALLGYLDQHRDVWLGYTIWSAGPWWGRYMFSVEPTGLNTQAPVDQNQMQVLLRHQ